MLFLAGSAINSIKGKNGKPDPRIGLEAMIQAIDIHRSGELKDIPMDEHLGGPGGPGPAEEPGRSFRGARATLSGAGCMIAKDERCIRIGVLGCGPIAQFAHFDACRKARNAELYAICDLADDLRERMAAVQQPKVAYRDYEAMLADPDVEAVIIAIADQFHVAAALKALDGRQARPGREAAGHARSNRACELRDMACETGLVVQVGNNRRFDPGIAFARKFIAEEMGQRIALKAWYYDSVYRYTMTDNLQPIPLASANGACDPRAIPRPIAGDTIC